VTLINHGQAADRLLSASSSAAARAELHAHLNEGGVMRMKALDVIVLAPGERVSLHPSGLHVMLVDLKAPLREGTRLTLTLGFAKAGEVTLEVPVLRNPPAEAGPGH
jgi:copper(I)-binding protein